jgi:hypothetical protein
MDMCYILVSNLGWSCGKDGEFLQKFGGEMAWAISNLSG